MALITRVSRLFRADLHAVLDRIEEPDLLLRQAVRDMEDELARDEQRLEALSADFARIAAREGELTRASARLEQELDVCFASNEDELARAVVRRKLGAERAAEALARRRGQVLDARATLEQRIAEQRARLESVRAQAQVHADAATADAATASEPWVASCAAVSADEVEVAYLRERQRRTRT
jgi:phage shock protein A